MKTVLFAVTHHSRNTVGLYPHLLGQANISVAIIAHPKYKPFVGRGASRWIDSSDDPNHIITQIAALFNNDPNVFNWVILGDDDLLRALAMSDLSDTMKTRIGPIGNAEYLPLLSGKAKASGMLSAAGIRVAPYKACANRAAIQDAVNEIGFPAIVKPDHSLGSEGVFICKTQQDVDAGLRRCKEGAYIVEKYIVGKQVRLDPLFLNGTPVTNNASLMTEMIRGDLGVSLARSVISAAPYIDFLTLLGKTLKLNGFMNFGVLHDGDSKEFYVFEIDCRPNAYTCMTKQFEIDIAAAIIAYERNTDFTVSDFTSPENGKIARSFIRDIPHIVRKRNIKGLIAWLTNADQRWECLPLHDLRLFMFWIWLVIEESAVSVYRKLRKVLKLSAGAVLSAECLGNNIAAVNDQIQTLGISILV